MLACDSGMILGACYLLWMVRKVLFGPLLEPVPHSGPGEAITVSASSHGVVRPVGTHEIAGLAPVMFLIVAIGLYPRPVLEQMGPTLQSIDKITHAQDGGGINKPSNGQPSGKSGERAIEKSESTPPAGSSVPSKNDHEKKS